MGAIMCRHPELCLPQDAPEEHEQQPVARKRPDASALVNYIQANDLHPTTQQLSSPGMSLHFPSLQPAWLQSDMPPELAATLRDLPSLARFLEAPVPEELGLVQFRVLARLRLP